MAGIRVLCTAMPAMLRDIVLELAAGEPAVGAVERLPPGADLLGAAQRFRPDVIIASGDDDATLCTVRDLLYSHPRARVLLISADGREAQLARLVPEAILLQDFSADDLINAVLGKTNGSGGRPWTR